MNSLQAMLEGELDEGIFWVRPPRFSGRSAEASRRRQAERLVES